MIKISGNRKKQLTYILIAIGFFSLSRGLWYNFQSLWLQQNGLSIKTISTVSSLSALGSVSLMLILFNYITKDKIKKFINILLFVKIITLCLLFCLNETNLFLIIKLLIFLDIIVDTEILTSIYPLITLFRKDDKLYGKKDLIVSSFYDLGVMFGGLFLGTTILNIRVSFNIFLLLSIGATIMSFLILNCIKMEWVSKGKKENIFSSIVSYIKKDRISQLYLVYDFLSNLSFYIITGLQMLLLVNAIFMPTNSAAIYLLVISIVSDIVGILILKKFTFKNNSLNILVKFGGRVVLYLIAFLVNEPLVYLLSLSYTLLFSNSYSHVINAPFINRVDNNYQLAFNNIKNMLCYAAKALGIWICGLGFIYGVNYLFLIAAIITLVQIIIITYTHKESLREHHV